MRTIGRHDYSMRVTARPSAKPLCQGTRAGDLAVADHVNISDPPFGSARSLDDAKQQFKSAWLAFKAKHGWKNWRRPTPR
jgi:hypothetical protein